MKISYYRLMSMNTPPPHVEGDTHLEKMITGLKDDITNRFDKTDQKLDEMVGRSEFNATVTRIEQNIEFRYEHNREAIAAVKSFASRLVGWAIGGVSLLLAGITYFTK